MTGSRPLSGIALALVWSALISGGGANAQAQDQPTGKLSTGNLASGNLANPLQAQSLDRLSVSRDRPLFSPSRRPPAPPPPPVERAPEAAAPPPPPDVTLFGVVVDGEGAHAIIRLGTGKMERVHFGDEVAGWKVSQIEGHRLVLSLDGRLATFTMFSREGGRRPPDDPASNAADKLQDQPRQNGAQQMAPQAAEPQPAASRKRRRARE
jgi:general secretion pathway protein N